MSQISLVVPVFNQLDELKNLINHLSNQKLKPAEIIIVDSSDDLSVKGFTESIEADFEIVYFYKPKKFSTSKKSKLSNIKLFRKFFYYFGFRDPISGRLYPSEATNFGVSKASHKLIALIDVCTIPKDDWLYKSYKRINEDGINVVFGSTIYASETLMQSWIKASTFGKKPIESNPGTLINARVIKENPLIEGVRAGADIEWRPRIKNKFSFHSPKNNFLTYKNLPNSLFQTMKKFFGYQLHASSIRVQTNYKDLIFSISLIFLTLVIFKWNTYMGWLLFIPNFLKAFLLSCNLFILMLLLIKRFKSEYFQNMNLTFTEKTGKYLLLVTLFFVSYRWNAIFASWAETSVFYIPHITKIYLFCLFLISIIYRGLVFPIRNGYKLRELLPINFIPIGLVGFMLDISKLPGFILGSIFSLLGINNQPTNEQKK